MIHLRVEGATRELGRAQGYQPLHIRDDVLEWEGERYAVMISAWTFTPEELAKINAGGSLILRIAGRSHPPVMLSVGDPPA